MAIYLVQHGKCLSKTDDPEKGLSEAGFEETHRLAPVAGGYRIPVQQIYHSGKKRAVQTAQIYQAALALEQPMEKLAGIGPMDDVRAFARSLDPGCGWMVVGHMPFMQRLVSYLTTGNETTLVYLFQNSGIVCLDAQKISDQSWDWYIKWTLNPNIS